MNNANLTGQLPFEFTPEPYLGKEDFMVAACNYEAFKLVDAWPDWPFFAVAFMVPRLRQNALGHYVCPQCRQSDALAV